MLVGLFMAMAPNDPTNHGLTFKAAKVICKSMGADIAPLFVYVMVSFALILESNRDGTDALIKEGFANGVREILRLFLDLCEPKESDLESESFDVADSVSDFPDELDASPQGNFVVADVVSTFSAAIFPSEMCAAFFTFSLRRFYRALRCKIASLASGECGNLKQVQTANQLLQNKENLLHQVVVAGSASIQQSRIPFSLDGNGNSGSNQPHNGALSLGRAPLSGCQGPLLLAALA